MKDQGMPLGNFRFCFPYEPCSQELKARMAALNAVTGTQIRANLARAAREAELARLEILDQRVKAQMKAEARDRIGQSMALAAQIRKAGYTAKRSDVSRLRQMARDFDDRTCELFRLGWLDKLPATCELYVTRVLDQRIADLEDTERQRAAKATRQAIAPAQSSPRHKPRRTPRLASRPELAYLSRLGELAQRLGASPRSASGGAARSFLSYFMI